MDFNNVDKETLIQTMFQQIQQLENDGLVDEHFKECYSLKEHSGPSFFLDLITVFLLDAKTAVGEMKRTLNQPVVDYKAMHIQCTKIKGSALCIGACPIRDACVSLCDAINREVREGCFQALQIIDNVHVNFYNRTAVIMKIEQEIISRK